MGGLIGLLIFIAVFAGLIKLTIKMWAGVEREWREGGFTFDLLDYSGVVVLSFCRMPESSMYL